MSSQIIDQIFKAMGFNVMIKISANEIKINDTPLDCSFFTFYLSKHSVKKEYYVYAELTEGEFLSLDISKYFSECYNTLKSELAAQEFLEPEIEKNTSFLLFVSATGREDIQRKIIDIEDNPYFFKKYVLDIDKTQLKSTFESIYKLGYEKRIIQFIQDTINDSEKFDAFKQNQIKNFEYQIISKIAIKIPIIPITTISKEKFTVNMNDILEKKLIESGLKDDVPVVKSLTKTINSSEFKALDDIEKMKILSKIYDGGVDSE